MEYIDTSKIKNPYVFLGLLHTVRPLTEHQKAERIIQEVCQYSGKTEEEMQMKCRREDIVHWRYMAIFLCNLYTKLTLTDIGKLFKNNKFDHSAVIQARERIRNRIACEENTEKDFNNLRKTLSKYLK